MYTPTIHIALVEDNAELRQLMQFMLDQNAGFSCKLVFPDAEQAIPEILNAHPDVVLMDIGLPGMSGVQAVEILREACPQLPILMLTIQLDDNSVFDSLCAGATGYLLKSTPPVQLLSAIQDAHAGGAPMSPAIARRVVASFRKPPKKSPLSAREGEVMALLCEGETYKTIAEQLFISANTVKAHIKHIYEKLHVNTRAEAVGKALRDDLI